MQFVSACSQASNCRAGFGHWWIYFLRIACNCTPASASWRKNCPLKHPEHCHLQVIRQLTCTKSQTRRWCWLCHVPGRHGLRCSGSACRECGPVQVAEGWLRATGHPHVTPPAFHCVCDTWAYAQVCLWLHSCYCVAHPSTGENSITPL